MTNLLPSGILKTLAEWIVMKDPEQGVYEGVYDGSESDVLDNEETVLRWLLTADAVNDQEEMFALLEEVYAFSTLSAEDQNLIAATLAYYISFLTLTAYLVEGKERLISMPSVPMHTLS